MDLGNFDTILWWGLIKKEKWAQNGSWVNNPLSPEALKGHKDSTILPSTNQRDSDTKTGFTKEETRTVIFTSEKEESPVITRVLNISQKTKINLPNNCRN